MQRFHSIDYLKLLLATCVVWAHAVLLTGYVSVPAYIFGQGLVRLAVPSFAVLSGFLFYRTWSRGRARAWLGALLAFYAFWCLFYLPLWLDGSMGPGDIALSLATGPLHLWYVAALALALTILAGLLTAMPDMETARRWLMVLASLCLLAGFSIQAVDFFTALDVPLNGYRNGLFVEFPFACFGFLVADRLENKGAASLPKAGVLAAALAGFAVLRLVEAALSLHFFGLSVVAPPEFPPLSAAFGVTLLLLTLKIRPPEPPLPLGPLSMGIYFLHYVAIVGLTSFGLTQIPALTALGTLLPMILVCLLFRLRLHSPLRNIRRG